MGGDDAFEVFFEAYERQLRAFALRRTRSPRAADELVAAVMEVAWRRFDRVPSESPFGWLCGVALRIAANDERSTRRRNRLLERVAAEAEARPAVAYLEDETLLVEQREAFELAFRRLSAEDREILRLTAWDGLSDVELGAVFGIGPAAVRKRSSRARLRLRARYAAASGDSGERP